MEQTNDLPGSTSPLGSFSSMSGEADAGSARASKVRSTGVETVGFNDHRAHQMEQTNDLPDSSSMSGGADAGSARAL
jgi:hypothetical protein